MKTYRIFYWLGSMTTEHYVKADSAEEAEKKFKALKGEKDIINIEEC